MSNQTKTKSVLRGGDYPLDAYSSHYAHKQMCQNCGHENNMRIIKGVKIVDAVRGENCENCGCRL